MLRKADKPGFDLAGWSKLARLGSTNAIFGLSEMVNQDVKVSGLSLEEVSMRNAVGLIGKADEPMVSIYLLFSGNASGHIMLAFRPETALELVDMAVGLPVGSTQSIGEMEQSVLGEIGNIAGSFFLNAVADDAGMRLMPSPPAVVMDMAGAIVGSVMAEVWDHAESAFAIRLGFATGDQQIEGSFIVLPNMSSMMGSGLAGGV